MSILKILQYPDSRLHQKSRKVTDVKSTKIKKVIKDMLETLANTQNCAALAATQLDIEEPPSIVVINSPDKNEIMTLINPHITAQKGSNVAEEGCMSIFPDHIHAEIRRANKIKVKALDTEGNQLKFTAEDFLARCIQHECDHLNGILYIDHLPKSKRALLEKEMLDCHLITKL